MIPNFRTSAVACAVALGVSILTAVAGNLMPDAVRSEHAVRYALRVVFFGALGILGFAAIPLMVNAVFDLQPGRTATSAGRAVITYVLWTLIGIGSFVAIPAAIVFGAFDGAHRDVRAGYAGKADAGIGLTLDEVRRVSTLPLDDTGRYPTRTSTGWFDFHIAGTPTAFRDCSLLAIGTDAARHVESIHVAIVSKPTSLPVLELFLETTAKRLATAGWRPLRSHGDFARGTTWLHLASARVGEYRSGEAENGGDWIATLDLAPAGAYKR